MAAKVITEDTIPGALTTYDTQLNEQRAQGGLVAVTPGREIAFDAAFTDAQLGSLPRTRTETRRDQLVSRQRWQFGLRDEAVGIPPHANAKGHVE